MSEADHLHGYWRAPVLAPPEPPVYKTVNTGLHVALSVITGGMWALFVWWPLHEAVKSRNKRKRIRYAAAMSEYRHAAWEQRYGQR